MADYKFDKPWAAESQNVQTFTDEEWGTGIVEKSLVSSSQVNGVMQAVTRRFLDLEAVENRQYRYDFVVDDELSWQNFISGNIGGAKSVLIRNGLWITSDPVVTANTVNLIQLEAYAKININGGLTMEKFGSSRISGGYVQGIINFSNCNVENINFSSSTILFDNTVVTNSYIYMVSGELTGGTIQTSIIDITNAKDAKFVDCTFTRFSQLTNCTLVRCTIPANTKLTNCTLIDCDYTVDTYKANLVTGTTFRNCNVTFTTTTETAGVVCDATNKAYGSTIEFHLAKSEHVSMIIYDSEIKYYRVQTVANSPLFTDSQFFGTSYMDVADITDSELLDLIDLYGVDIKVKNSIITSIPFFRSGNNFRTYNATPGSFIYPGVVNKVGGNDSKSTRTTAYAKQKFFVQFTGNISTTAIVYGKFKFTPSFEYTMKSPGDDPYGDAYNMEFIAPSGL